MKERIATFVSTGCTTINLPSGPLTIHVGFSPYATDKGRDLKGRKVLFEGVVRTIRGTESHTLLRPLRVGDPIGLVFEDMIQ